MEFFFVSWTSDLLAVFDVFQSVSRTCVQSCSLGKRRKLRHKRVRHSRNPAVVKVGLVGTDL